MTEEDRKEYDGWIFEMEGLAPLPDMPKPLSSKDWESKEAYLKKAAEIDKVLSAYGHVVFHLRCMRSDLKQFAFEAHQQSKPSLNVQSDS